MNSISEFLDIHERRLVAVCVQGRRREFSRIVQHTKSTDRFALDFQRYVRRLQSIEEKLERAGEYAVLISDERWQ